jgi:hypothetical protein
VKKLESWVFFKAAVRNAPRRVYSIPSDPGRVPAAEEGRLVNVITYSKTGKNEGIAGSHKILIRDISDEG